LVDRPGTISGVKTLVTGGNGFVGLNVVEALLARGEDVVVLSDSDMPANALRVLQTLPGTLQSARADVADAAAVDRVFSQHEPGRVIHAAVITAGQQRELAAFDRVVDVNLKGTAHVLAAAAEHGVRRFVYVSSGSAYGRSLLDAERMDEETPPQPDTLYSITKYASERVCARFRELRGLEVICVRLGSVFGPWERDTGVRDTLSLPYQIVQIARRGEEVILPQREPRRDWIYSRDVASGIVGILESNRPGHTLYNLSAGATWPGFARGWCSALRALYPVFRYRIATAEEPANVEFLGDRDRAMMAIERMRSDLGFQPAYADESAFTDYIDWLRGNTV
jgi:nucleoside-diphosphate-sugar epimerase